MSGNNVQQYVPFKKESSSVITQKMVDDVLKLLGADKTILSLGDATHEGGNLDIYRDGSNNKQISIDADAGSNEKAVDVYGGVVVQNHLTVGQTSLDTTYDLRVSGTSYFGGVLYGGWFRGTKLYTGDNISTLLLNIPVTDAADHAIKIQIDTNDILIAQATGNGSGGITDTTKLVKITGSTHMSEITTPTAIANYGAIYPKNTNKLFFQDGAGAEDEITCIAKSQTLTNKSITLLNDDWLESDNFADTGVINIIKVNSSDEIEVGATMRVGLLVGKDDSGAVTLFDMPVSATPVAGTEESAVIKIDATTIFKFYAEADSAGGIQNPAAISEQQINIKEITTPTAIANYGALYPKSDNKMYFQDGAGNEKELTTTSSYYADMYLNNNSNATIISTQNYPVLIKECLSGFLAGFTFDAGRTVDANIATEADATQLQITTSAAHSLTTGDIVSLSGMNNAAHNGVTIVTVVDATNFTCDDITYVANAGASAGRVDEGSSLTVGTGAAGKYIIQWHASSTPAAAATFKLQIYKNNVACTHCIGQRKYAQNDQGNLMGGAITTLADDDTLYLSITCTTGTVDITNQYGDLSLHRL